jgi:hypothetical protein
LKDNGGGTVALGHASPANAPTGAGWYSTINDGDADGSRGLGGADAEENAAFAISFDVNGNRPADIGGRVFDPVSLGGPGLDYAHYPSATGLPAAAVNCNGKLIGMGCGYSSFTPSTIAGENEGGVGLAAGTASCSSLGEKVLFEGQISMTGLANGTYTLVLTAGAGTNVLVDTGDMCAFGSPSDFADAGEIVNGDQIIFTYEGATTPLAIVSSVSRKTHGAAGAFDIPSGDSEGRYMGGTSYGPTKIVTTFNQDIARVNGDSTDVTVSSGTIGTITTSGAELTVNMSSITDGTAFTISYPGIVPAGGGSAISDQSCWRVLGGNCYPLSSSANKVDTLDLLFCRNSLNKTVTAANFRYDVFNSGGTVNTIDLLYLRNRLNRTCAVCP